MHRLSGLLLALFLPLHFLALSLAIRGEESLDGFLRWTEHPLVETAEVILVLLLAAHFTGGVRLLVIELTPWRDWQKSTVAIAGGVSIAIGLAFALSLG